MNLIYWILHLRKSLSYRSYRLKVSTCQIKVSYCLHKSHYHVGRKLSWCYQWSVNRITYLLGVLHSRTELAEDKIDSECPSSKEKKVHSKILPLWSGLKSDVVGIVENRKTVTCVRCTLPMYCIVSVRNLLKNYSSYLGGNKKVIAS